MEKIVIISFYDPIAKVYREAKVNKKDIELMEESVKKAKQTFEQGDE